MSPAGCALVHARLRKLPELSTPARSRCLRHSGLVARRGAAFLRPTIGDVESRARLGGWLAIGASLGLLGVVLARGVGLNVLNGWTIVIGAGGGLFAITRPQPPALGVASALVFLAMLPALFGGLGLLYLPAQVLIAPLRRQRRRGAMSSSSVTSATATPPGLT